MADEWDTGLIEPDEDEDLDALLAELPTESAYVKVYWQDEEGTVRFKGQHPVNTFADTGRLYDFIRKKYGGGRLYVLDFYRPYRDGTGKTSPKRQKRHRQFLDKTEEEIAEEEERKEARAAALRAPSLDETALARIVTEANKPLAESIGQLAAALANRPQQPQQDFGAIVQMAQVLKTFQSMIPPPAPAADLGATFGTIKEMMGMAKEFASPDGDGNPLKFMSETVDKLLPVLMQPAPVSPSNQGQTTSEAPAQVTAQPSETQSTLQLRAAAGMLMSAAQAGQDPGNYVGMIVDSVDRAALEPFLADPVNQLARLDARASANQAWIAELVALIREDYAEQDRQQTEGDTGTDDAKSEGDNTDATDAGNAGASA